LQTTIWVVCRGLLDPIKQHVDIAQKTVEHSPVDKLTDALVAILAGAHGIVEINIRLRADPVLQRAFGREACAGQSVVQRTLNARTTDNIKQMRFACDVIFQHRSRAGRHRFATTLLLLDIDVTAMVCGAKSNCGCMRAWLPLGRSGRPDTAAFRK